MRGLQTIIAVVALMWLISGSCSASAAAVWQAPFDTLGASAQEVPARLTLTDALRLTAGRNPGLKALAFKQKSSQGELDQAGLRPNPELEAEVEEVGWDAPGFDESEVTVSVSQEFELFGQRGARRRAAQVGVEAASLEARIAAFDLYLKVKSRFFALAHAQRRAMLADSSVALAEGVFGNIARRTEKGATLKSELVLARLELERVRLECLEARQDESVAHDQLAALWGGSPDGISAAASGEPDLQAVFDRLPPLTDLADSSREMVLLENQAAHTAAELQLAAAEAKPTITLTGGYKHLRGTGSNSLLFGIGMPLPLWNRNQGTTASFEAQLRSLEFEQQQIRIDALAQIRAGTEKLSQLIERYAAVDSLLRPTAAEAYAVLETAYEAGRVPFTSLLEAERSLIELNFAHNDILLAIQEQVIALERLTGVTLWATSE